MQGPAAPLILLAALFLLSCTPPCDALKFRVLDNCQSGDGSAPAGQGGQPGIAIEVTAAEFYASFASIFRLTDGSRISVPAGERMESLRYMQYLLRNVHVRVNEAASQEAQSMQGGTGSGEGGGGGAADVLEVCGSDAIDLLLLAVVGNFVSVPGDVATSAQSSLETMPSVAIDAYTGQLVMRTPYDAVRGYFVEALLVLSIIAISRLTFVRNNVYTTVVHLPLGPGGDAAESVKGR